MQGGRVAVVDLVSRSASTAVVGQKNHRRGNEQGYIADWLFTDSAADASHCIPAFALGHVAQGHECVDQSATTGKRASALSSTAGGDKKRGGRKVSGRTDLTKLAVYVEPSGLDLSRLTCMYRLGSADVLCHMDARDGE